MFSYLHLYWMIFISNKPSISIKNKVYFKRKYTCNLIGAGSPQYGSGKPSGPAGNKKVNEK